MSRSIGINTEPLDIHLYIDIEGRIRWKYSDNITHTNEQYSETISNKPDKKTYIETIFPNMYKISEYLLDCQTSNIVSNHNNYVAFDYLEYKKIYVNGIDRKNLWDHYIKNNSNDFLNYHLESRYIDGLINILKDAITKNYKEILISFKNEINLVNVNKYEMCKNEYEYSQNMIVFCDSLNVNTIFNINSVLLRNEAIIEFLDLIKQYKYTWRMAIINYIDNNYFNVTMSDIKLFE